MHGIDKICINMAQQIASHPLILANLIENPITGAKVPISSYRLYGGIETSNNVLACAVYPAPINSLGAKSAEAKTATMVYKPYTLGKEYDEVMSMIHVSFYYNSVTAGAQSTPIILQNMPTQLPLTNDEIVIENNINVELYTDVAMHILSQCTELLRLIIYDIELPWTNSKIEVLRSSFIGGEWEKHPYFKEAMTTCLVTTYPPKASKLVPNINNIQIQYKNK